MCTTYHTTTKCQPPAGTAQLCPQQRAVERDPDDVPTQTQTDIPRHTGRYCFASQAPRATRCCPQRFLVFLLGGP